jgi:hypothetical protein
MSVKMDVLKNDLPPLLNLCHVKVCILQVATQLATGKISNDMAVIELFELAQFCQDIEEGQLSELSEKCDFISPLLDKQKSPSKSDQEQ